MNKRIVLFFLCILFSSMITNSMTAQTTESSFKREWKEKDRSVSTDMPITIYIENNQLLIQSRTMRSDINIQIIDSSSFVVYEKIILAENTGSICVNLEKGSYTLNLTNQWGGYLYGTFEIK